MNKKVLYLGLLAPIAVAPLAVVASCADTSNIGNKAFDNIQRSLDYWSRSQTLTLPTDIKNPFQIPTLKSTENFGFITNIPSVSNPDNAKGTIDVKVNIRRGPSENYEKTFTVGGFKTAKQDADEKANNSTVQGSTLFSKPTDVNAAPGILRMDVKSDKKTSNIDEIIKQVNETENDDPNKDKKMDKLIELTGITKEKTTNFNNLQSGPASNKVTEILAQKLDKGQLLKLVDIKSTGDFGVSSGIEARVQIVDKDKTSAIYVLLIGDFELKIEDSKAFLDQFTNDYLSGKLLNQTKITPETQLMPFNKSTDNLASFLLSEGGNNNGNGTASNNGKGVISIDSKTRIQYELLDGGHIKGSEDSVSKSLRAKFKFSIEKQTDTEIEKEVTLYGFDFK